MSKFFDKPWFYRILSLMIAIAIVAWVDNTQTGYVSNQEHERTQQTATKTQTLTVPLQVSVNTDKYFVTGYPEKVKLKLEGATSLITSAVNTQNFRVYIDLTNLGVGKHRVPVKVSGLSNQLSYRVSPTKINVDIQRRKSRSFPVQIEYNKSAVAKGYNLGDVKATPKIVTATGARSEIDRIDKIVAKVALPMNTTRTYQRQVILLAEDSKGHQLNIVIEPSTVNVEIPVTLSHKKVKLKLNSKNEANNKDYTLTASPDSVEIYGSKAELKDIKDLAVDVDLSNITQTQTKRVKLQLPKGIVKADTDTVEINIKVNDSSQMK